MLSATIPPQRFFGELNWTTLRAERAALLATAAVVGLQVLLPRVFSVVLWYHLGFFAVSLAVLGGALGGLYVRRRAARGAPALDCSAAGILAGAVLLVALAVVVRLPVDPLRLQDLVRALREAGPAGLRGDLAVAPALLLLTGILLALPFTVLGAIICQGVAAAGERVARTYAATFLGGAGGAALALAGMQYAGPARTAVALALLPALAAPRALLSGPGAFLLVLAGSLAAQPDAVLPLHSRKHFPRIPEERVLEEHWNAFSRITLYENPDRHGLWAMPAHFRGPLPQSIGVAIDSWAITSILSVGADQESRRFLESYPPTLAYHGAKPGFRALVIGAGGGVDVLAALAAGASHVTAVEINPLIVAAVRGRFREFAGGLYDDPRVTVVVGEGRHFADATDQRFDRIVLSGVDTFAATEAGAFALSENYLYTVEALRTYLERLAADGVLALTRWWYEPPRQTLRLALTAEAVLRGRAAPEEALFVARTGNNSVTLIKPDVFRDPELAILAAGAAVRGLTPVYARGLPMHPAFAAALAPGAADRFAAEWSYRIDPTTDDRPFFFETTRLARAFRTEGDWIHDALGGQEMLLVTVCVLLLLSLPLLAAGSRGGGPALPFALLGFAYLMVEIPLLQQLSLVLGHPVLAVAVALVGLLLGSGAGALAAERMLPERCWFAALTAAAAVAGVVVVCHPELTAAARGAGTAERAVAVLGFLALPAFTMGIPFPLALRALCGGRPQRVAKAWVVNGVASVLAAPLAVMGSMELGFRATELLGAGCYAAGALALLAAVRRPGATNPALS